MNYLVVLFKNKERKKIINKFKTFEKAENFYKSLLAKNENIDFHVEVENTEEVTYELGLLQKNNKKFDKFFVKDGLGRQIKIELDDSDLQIIEISNYKISEKIYSVDLKKRVHFEDFVKIFLPNQSIKLVSKLNNKIVVQNDNNIKLFSLKNELESKRFLNVLSNYLISENRSDCLLVFDTSKEQKKYLYDILSKQGIDKNILYRVSTTFKKRK